MVLLLVVVAAVAIVPRVARGPGGGASSAATQTAGAQPEEAQTFPTVPTSPAGPTAQAAQAAVPAGAHPTPQEETFKGCPPTGDGTDPELNTLKNGIDPVASPAPMPFATLLHQPWPTTVNRQHMAQWSPADRAQIARTNGLGVTVEAYFIRVQAGALSSLAGAIVKVYQVGTLEERIAALEQAQEQQGQRRAG